MRKIASPHDLQAELQRLLAYCQGPGLPSRERLAGELRGLATLVSEGTKVAARSNSLSWKLYLGGDPRNYNINRQEDAPGWGESLKQIIRELGKLKTTRGGRVEAVTERRGVLSVYFVYPDGIDEEVALYDSETSLKKAVEVMSRQYDHWAFLLHGDLYRSDLEIRDEAIESWGERIAASTGVERLVQKALIRGVQSPWKAKLNKVEKNTSVVGRSWVFWVSIEQPPKRGVSYSPSVAISPSFKFHVDAIDAGPKAGSWSLQTAVTYAGPSQRLHPPMFNLKSDVEVAQKVERLLAENAYETVTY